MRNDNAGSILKKLMAIEGAQPSVAVATVVVTGAMGNVRPEFVRICEEFLFRLDRAAEQRMSILRENPSLSPTELIDRIDRDPRVFELEAEILKESATWLLDRGGKWESRIQ